MPAKILGHDLLITQVTEETLALVDSGIPTPIILIDGRAGSGKSTLAEKIQNDLFRQGESMPRIIHMDDLYEGWHGLAAGTEYLQRFILSPLLTKQTASWQEYNWQIESRDRWREFSGGTPLIIEGCGAINQYTSSIAHLGIWLEVDEETRRQRWLERDGEIFDQYFDTWAAQELDFIAREKSPTLADYELRSSSIN
ncbi:MAG: ATP-binding protein [Rhodoluna sp.]|jgi:uridine kinase|nr:ATP-binding protein [Rhodoluna sp.]